MTLSPRYGRFLNDFKVGETYAHPWEVTIDAGFGAFYAASFQDSTPLYASDEAAKALGFPARPLHPLLCLNLALSFSVHDVSEQAIAHLAYVDVRFPDAGRYGDTVRARSTVMDVKPSSSGDKGVVHVRTMLETTDGRVLCAFERKALVRVGSRQSTVDGAEAVVAPPVPPLDELGPKPRELDVVRNGAPRATGFARWFDDFEQGQVFAHGIGHTVGDSEHMQLTTLFRNSHPLHFDELYSKTNSFTKHRVVYGGLVFGWVAALASRDVAGNAVWDLQYASGAHPSSVAAGDTLYAASRVLTVDDIGDAGVGAVTFGLVGVKNVTSLEAVEKHGEALFAAELNKKDNKITEKVFEIRRTLLVAKRPR